MDDLTSPPEDLIKDLSLHQLLMERGLTVGRDAWTGRRWSRRRRASLWMRFSPGWACSEKTRSPKRWPTRTGYRLAAASDFPVQPVAAERLSQRFLRDIRAAPLRESGGTVDVAFVDPLRSFSIGTRSRDLLWVGP